VADHIHRFACLRRYRLPMIESESVYWRRRAAAVVATIVAVFLLAWIIGGLIGDDSPEDPGPADLAGLRDTRTSVPPSSPPPMSRYTKTSGPTTTAPPATTTTKKPKPPAPIQCADAAVTITAQLGASHYKVGQHPLMKIVISNDGQLACTRDISRKLRELLVVSADGVKRLWSSNDCADPEPGKDVRLLQPGQKVTFSITWAGRTSAKGCPADRSTVRAGEYYVVAKLGKLASHPTPMKLTG
jgi:hypothetical protein